MKVLGAVATAAQAALVAIESLVNFIIVFGKHLLGLLVQPIQLIMESYISKLWSGITSVLSSFNSTGSLNSSQEFTVLSSLLGTLVIASVVLTAGISLAIFVIEGFALGTGFLAVTLIGLLVTAVMTAAEYAFSLAGVSLSSAFFSSATISMAETVYGGPHTPAAPSPSGSGTCAAWTFWLYVFGAAAGAIGVYQALSAVRGLIPSWQSVTYMIPFVSLFLGIIGLFLATYEYLNGSNGYLSAAGFIFSIAGLLLLALGYETKPSSLSFSSGDPVSTIGYIDVILGAAGVGLSAYDLKQSC